MTFSFGNLLRIYAPSTSCSRTFLFISMCEQIQTMGSPESCDWKNLIFACESAYLTLDFLVLWLYFIMHVPSTGLQNNKYSVFFLTFMLYVTYMTNIYSNLSLIKKLSENPTFILSICYFWKAPIYIHFPYHCKYCTVFFFHCHFICIKYLFVIIK